jgi:hypothetical protein
MYPYLYRSVLLVHSRSGWEISAPIVDFLFSLLAFFAGFSGLRFVMKLLWVCLLSFFLPFLDVIVFAARFCGDPLFCAWRFAFFYFMTDTKLDVMTLMMTCTYVANAVF